MIKNLRVLLDVILSAECGRLKRWIDFCSFLDSTLLQIGNRARLFGVQIFNPVIVKRMYVWLCKILLL